MRGHLQQDVYLHVVVVFARQLHGQLTFGLGTPIPQPADFRGQLQVLDREDIYHRWDGAGSRSATAGAQEEGRGEEN